MAGTKHPIDNVQWLPVEVLVANEYNPNAVQPAEMRLLGHSILTTGWLQPILACPVPKKKDLFEIIDGFHRATLVKTNKKVAAFTDGKVPVCVMKLSEAERIMLTIRINRAKGTHMAFRMSDCVQRLVNEHKLSRKAVMEGIGASTHEVELLMQKDVFSQKDIANHVYSKAWYPK